MRDTNWLATVLISAAVTSAVQVPLHAEDCGTNRPSRWFSFRSKSAQASPGCAVPEPAGLSAPVCSAPANVPQAASADVPSAPTNPQVASAAVAPAPAMFSAPAASGEITGASQRWGVQLPSLTIPEMRLQLPTVHMPSIVRSSRDAEMYVDGGRAPRVAGMPAAYGQLVNAAPVSGAQQLPTASPASVGQGPKTAVPAAVPAGAPAAAPAGVDNCVPQTAHSFGASQQATDSPEAELIETRKAVIMLSERLQRLQREVEIKARSNGPIREAELPPSPTSSDRRTSYSNTIANAAPLKQNTSAKIVRAGYSESESEENEEPLRRADTRTRRGNVSEAAAENGEWSAAPVKKVAPPRQGAGHVRGNLRYQVVNQDTSEESYEDVMVDSRLGKSTSGVGKRSNR